MARESLSSQNGSVASTTGTTYTNVSPTQSTQNRINFLLNGAGTKAKGAAKKPEHGPAKKLVAIGLNGYRWNLPPHVWSMPVEPYDISGKQAVDNEKLEIGSTHKYRRGRVYWYARVDNEYMKSSFYNSGNDPRYGFQFMWNPTSIQTSVQVNMQTTPSFADKFVDVVGAFPSGESLTLELRLDRTNDFASIKNITKSASHKGLQKRKDVAKVAGQYYPPNLSFDYGYAETLTQKIIDLQELGTIADLEYLYKAINGPGWTNAATGRKSSDIGFLRPTLLRIDLGPLSYLGYVSAMSVNHIAFTKSMIPIRTDVALQFNLMATAGLAAK